jgi:c-di-GMP-binding flagellar brake protein YcgR
MPIPEHQRREHQRLKVVVPIEILVEGTESPLRGATSDLSVSGCYIETIFPLAIGTILDLKLQLGGTLLVMAKVVTSDPQVGNGIEFTRMLPEDVEELRTFIAAHESETAE